MDRSLSTKVTVVATALSAAVALAAYLWPRAAPERPNTQPIVVHVTSPAPTATPSPVAATAASAGVVAAATSDAQLSPRAPPPAPLPREERTDAAFEPSAPAIAPRDDPPQKKAIEFPYEPTQ
jgi:hypothetical protein